MITVATISKAAPGWSPSPFQAPALRPRLAQTVVTSSVTPPGGTVLGPPRAPLIDSALVNLIFDSLGATACGLLAYGSNNVGATKWAIIYGSLALLLTVRAGNNLYDVRER
jgi:hypothetical protein